MRISAAPGAGKRRAPGPRLPGSMADKLGNGMGLKRLV
jgi:hypothetical protein